MCECTPPNQSEVREREREREGERGESLCVCVEESDICIQIRRFSLTQLYIETVSWRGREKSRGSDG